MRYFEAVVQVQSDERGKSGPMIPMAKLWTYVGNSFVPLVVVWGFYVRNGFTDTPSLGVRVSRAYLGLDVTLAAAAVLALAFALYARSAARAGASLLVPPNTMFEEAADRNQLISWATTAVYSASVLAALIVFAQS